MTQRSKLLGILALTARLFLLAGCKPVGTDSDAKSLIGTNSKGENVVVMIVPVVAVTNAASVPTFLPYSQLRGGTRLAVIRCSTQDEADAKRLARALDNLALVDLVYLVGDRIATASESGKAEQERDCALVKGTSPLTAAKVFDLLYSKVGKSGLSASARLYAQSLFLALRGPTVRGEAPAESPTLIKLQQMIYFELGLRSDAAKMAQFFQEHDKELNPCVNPAAGGFYACARGTDANAPQDYRVVAGKMDEVERLFGQALNAAKGLALQDGTSAPETTGGGTGDFGGGGLPSDWDNGNSVHPFDPSSSQPNEHQYSGGYIDPYQGIDPGSVQPFDPGPIQPLNVGDGSEFGYPDLGTLDALIAAQERAQEPTLTATQTLQLADQASQVAEGSRNAGSSISSVRELGNRQLQEAADARKQLGAAGAQFTVDGEATAMFARLPENARVIETGDADHRTAAIVGSRTGGANGSQGVLLNGGEFVPYQSTVLQPTTTRDAYGAVTTHQTTRTSISPTSAPGSLTLDVTRSTPSGGGAATDSARLTMFRDGAPASIPLTRTDGGFTVRPEDVSTLRTYGFDGFLPNMPTYARKH